ncbi:hypothetical protein ACIG56_27205 [Nocardia fusca]|uniref:hypothetical protein n=1 Tax=Nocardia fusca TaxID=941183 RepID=UPI0037CA8B37
MGAASFVGEDRHHHVEALPAQVREKAVRLALERLDEYGSAYAAARAIGPLVDVHHKTLRLWIKKALDGPPSPGAPASPGLSSAERDELTRLRKEVRDLEQSNGSRAD